MGKNDKAKASVSNWSLNIEGDMAVDTPQQHESLRSFARGVVRAAIANGLTVAKATVSPSDRVSDDVGVTDEEQVANAQMPPDETPEETPEEVPA